MTKKEKIREVLSVYDAYAYYYDGDDDFEKTEFNYDGENFHLLEEDVEKAKEVIKDLEVLEILKKIIKKFRFYVKDDWVEIDNPGGDGEYIQIKISKNKRKLLKEWLENDKRWKIK